MAFSMDEDRRVLELEMRRRIYIAVRDCAGCHLREIERRTGESAGAVSYHINYLKRHGLLKQEKDGNKVRYFPSEFPGGMLMGMLRQGSVRRIILQIVANDGCSQNDIVQSVHLAPSTVSWHLSKLLENGIVKSVKRGRNTHYMLTSDRKEVMKLLITYKDSFLDKILDNAVEMWVME